MYGTYRQLQKSISQISQTTFRKMDVMYASHPKENYAPSCEYSYICTHALYGPCGTEDIELNVLFHVAVILNAFQPTKRDALKLAKTILLNSPPHPNPSRTGRQNSRRKRKVLRFHIYRHTFVDSHTSQTHTYCCQDIWHCSCMYQG